MCGREKECVGERKSVWEREIVCGRETVWERSGGRVSVWGSECVGEREESVWERERVCGRERV